MNVYLKICISLLSLILIGVHHFLPNFKVDAVTLALLAISVLPWLLQYIAGFEIPNVVKIDLRDTKSATDKVAITVRPQTGVVSAAGEAPEVKATRRAPYSAFDIRATFDLDPSLSLVAFRIEIEMRIRALVASHELLNERVPLQRMIRALVAKDVIDPNTGSGLMEIVALGNQAAHGAKVTENAAAWVHDIGPGILLQLDDLLNDVKTAD